MIDEYIEALSEELSAEQKQRCERLAEERYEALRNTIAHLYGKKFLFELEMNVSGIIRRSLLENTIPCRLGLLRRQYRHTCNIIIPYNPIGKAAYRGIYEQLKMQVYEQRERHALNQMRKRAKVRQRYNRLAEVILRDLGEEQQKELIWKAEVRALAEIMDKCKYGKSSAIKGYFSNDRSFALRHLRILYAYQIERRENMCGNRIHLQINANYRNSMLDYNQANKL